MVLVCHYWLAPDIAQAAPSSLHVFGFRIFASGVDLFFVLSGFLIGGILLDHRDSPEYFRVFYARRVVRIFPVYYGFLIITAALGILFHVHHRSTPVFDAGTPYWMFVLFLQNFSIAWYGDYGWITVTMAWSLALEEQFYLTLPAAVRKLNIRLLVGISALILVMAPVLRSRFADTPHTLGSLALAAVRVDALVAGFVCAVLVRSRFSVSSISLSLAAICLACLVAVTHIDGSPVAFLRETSLLGLYSSILLLAVQGSLRILQFSLLRFFGTISYTLYLVHQSALVLLHSIVRHRVPSAIGGEAIMTSLVALLLSVAACWVSWSYFEKPMLSWARRRFRY